ncbi:unnamed protein product [Cylicocyclus nassatus]|uniref:Secreted protein n=1 Tax=Cylicocyclus nassatus TaxID=53992 RepID=A0AA36GWY1_CYLNA|nr:unnamed protein product [Cylicocyclus nassatus]
MAELLGMSVILFSAFVASVKTCALAQSGGGRSQAQATSAPTAQTASTQQQKDGHEKIEKEINEDTMTVARI